MLLKLNFVRYFLPAYYLGIIQTEAVFWRCSVEKVLLKISQNSQEKTCARASFLIKLHTLIRKRLWNSGTLAKFVGNENLF